MPCPVCIGYEVAYSTKYMHEDEEKFKELWQEIDEMLVEESHKPHKW